MIRWWMTVFIPYLTWYEYYTKYYGSNKHTWTINVCEALIQPCIHDIISGPRSTNETHSWLFISQTTAITHYLSLFLSNIASMYSYPGHFLSLSPCACSSDLDLWKRPMWLRRKQSILQHPGSDYTNHDLSCLCCSVLVYLLILHWFEHLDLISETFRAVTSDRKYQIA